MRAFLKEPNTTKKSHEGENSRFLWGVSSMQGWRASMEDAHFVNLDIGDGSAVFAVFDGHGGHEVAEFAAKNFITGLRYLDSFKKRDYSKALTECFKSLDDLMRTEEGHAELIKIKFKGMATTTEEAKDAESHAGCAASVVMITPTQIICANSGDSRAVLSVQGKAIPLSIDHKPTDPKERQRIIEADGFVERKRVNGDLALSRTLGDFDFKQDPNLPPEEQIVTCVPDIHVENITGNEDFIILACDGIWDCMSSQEAVDFVYSRLIKTKSKDGCPQAIIEEMFDKNLSKYPGEVGSDNMTCIIAKFIK